jgi:hypothetical protein
MCDKMQGTTLKKKKVGVLLVASKNPGVKKMLTK